MGDVFPYTHTSFLCTVIDTIVAVKMYTLATP